MIDQVLIEPHCVTKDIWGRAAVFYFGTATALVERSRGAPSARKTTAKKEKTKLGMQCHLHLNKVGGKWELE